MGEVVCVQEIQIAVWESGQGLPGLNTFPDPSPDMYTALGEFLPNPKHRVQRQTALKLAPKQWTTQSCLLVQFCTPNYTFKAVYII